MRRTGTGWQASCGWLPSRYCAATATWVRATGIFAHGLAPPKQSRRWHATWPASSTASSPKVRHGWIAEPNNTSRTAKSVIWPDFRLRPAHVDSASCPPRIKSPEMPLNRSEFLESERRRNSSFKSTYSSTFVLCGSPERRAPPVQPARRDARGASPSHGEPRSREDLHQPRGASEPHDPHVNAPLDAANQCVFKEVGESRGRLLRSPRLLRLLPDSQVGCESRLRWKQGSRIVFGNRRSF